MQILTISPKGQITIPKKLREFYKNKSVAMEVINKTIVLYPIKLAVEKEDLADFALLAQKAFDFWDNAQDDIYEEFYKRKNDSKTR